MMHDGPPLRIGAFAPIHLPRERGRMGVMLVSSSLVYGGGAERSEAEGAQL
jgi:hypothetical protein